MNYTEYIIENTKNSKVLIITDIHNCHKDFHEKPNELRMNVLCDELQAEYEREQYDLILCLGDYSLDFWAWDEGGSYLKNPPISYTEDFIKRFYLNFPVKAYMIPGNHEQYGETDWRRITGFPREFVVVYGEYVFVMLDTFAGELDPKEDSDGVYTGINTELVKKVLKKHPEKSIILCMHDLIPELESETAMMFIKREERILCAFAGHIHRDNTVLLPNSWRNLPVFYCGDFSYNAGRLKDINWGYRILNLDDNKFSTEYIRVNC